MIFRADLPRPLVAYSPVSLRRAQLARQQTQRFIESGASLFFLSPPELGDATHDFFATPFWVGDTVSSVPLSGPTTSLDEQARWILSRQPQAQFIIRFGTHEPASWRDLHPDELFQLPDGERLACPSLASRLYNQQAAEFSKAQILHCESYEWSDSIIGYANFLRLEGTHEPLISGHLFDHSPAMQAVWAERFEQPLPARFAEFSDGLYFQGESENLWLRRYIELSRDLFHQQFEMICHAMDEARCGKDRLLFYDALKIGMMGWNNGAFFNPAHSWPHVWPEDRAGSGHLHVARLFDLTGFDGLITPHDYHARGVGGVYEPEGIVDSCVLRGKLFLCEMDTRTFAGHDVNFPARDIREFEALTWRNLATGLTRGFESYWMDVYEDWFAPELHPIIARQIEVLNQAHSWPHSTFPGIAIILDDEAILETNGSGHVFNEHILWEPKLGLAHCGVPVRTYLFADLELDNFPAHHVFYFPNLYRADPQRLRLLREKVLKEGHVVVWGPGSGISNGQCVSAQSATELTGFEFEFAALNYPRRALWSNSSHPLGNNLCGVTGGPLAFGPVLYPTSGQELARAWTQGGRDYCAIAVLDQPDWRSVFVGATPLPAQFWRNATRWAGGHVWCDSDDVLLTNGHLLALHSIQSGPKSIRLPRSYDVYDVATGTLQGASITTLEFDLEAPQTRVFRLRPGSERGDKI